MHKNREQYLGHPRMTEGYIKATLRFALAVTFPQFAEEEFISPDYHEEFDRLRAQFGEQNVLSSLFQDHSDKLYLGIFIRNDVMPDDSRGTF